MSNGYRVCGPFLVEGGPGQVTRTFTCARPSTPGPYRLWLRSGQPHGTGRPSSVHVTWNGQPLFSPNNFNANVPGVSSAVSLEDSNTLEIRATGSQVQLTAELVDESETCFVAGPYQVSSQTGALQESFLRKNAFAQPEFQLSGDGAGQSSVRAGRISLNGNVILQGGELKDGASAVWMPVQLGPENLLSAEAPKKGSLTLQVVDRDVTPPSLTVSQPAAGGFTNQPALVVAGTVNDASSAVTINGVVASVLNGQYTATVPLAEGYNTLSVVAADFCQNRSTAQVTVGLDTVAPVLSIEQPVSGSVSNQTEQPVILKYQDGFS
ncbi:MAG TPA: hypothetical protein VF815_06145, partial [Myxococcaceae bacterium]